MSSVSADQDGDFVTVGFDVGGTNLRSGVVTASGEIIDHRSAATPLTASELEDAIAQHVAEYRSAHHVKAVGVALAGFIDAECENVRFAPHLPWRNAPVKALLHQRTGLPVRIEHDANSAAWGEYRFGAAQGANTWVLFAIGTGIGATLMTNGEIFRGAYGTAPEFGHLIVQPGGRACPCGKLGCLERYCSGGALVDTAVELVHQHSFVGSELATRVRRDPTRVTGSEVMASVRAGDPTGRAVLENFSRWLGTGLSIVADVLDPELILIGGGVAADSDLFLDLATEQFSAQIVGTGYRPLAKIGAAKLGAHAGLVGVADLARHSVNSVNSVTR